MIGNPGTSTSPTFLVLGAERVASALCIFENNTSFLAWSADAWVAGYPRSSFYALPHTIQPAEWKAMVDHAFSENCGWVYTTDDGLPNPWDTLPSFFEALVAYVDATY